MQKTYQVSKGRRLPRKSVLVVDEREGKTHIPRIKEETKGKLLNGRENYCAASKIVQRGARVLGEEILTETGNVSRIHSPCFPGG